MGPLHSGPTRPKLTVKMTVRALLLLTLVASASAINVVDNLNLTAYFGVWYQMYDDLSATATFEHDAYCATANYTLRDDGKVSVHNQERYASPTGDARGILGYAYAPNASEPAKLKVHFDVNPVDGNYWVVKLGPQTTTNQAICSPCYDYAIVFDYLNQEGFNTWLNTPVPTYQGKDCIYP